MDVCSGTEGSFVWASVDSAVLVDATKALSALMCLLVM